MIIIQQTQKPTPAGSHQDVNIFDASGNALTSTAGRLNVDGSGGITNSDFETSPNFAAAAFVPLTSQAAKKVLVANYTGVTILVSKNAGVSSFPVLNNSSLCVEQILNADEISLKRQDATAVNVNANLIIYN